MKNLLVLSAAVALAAGCAKKKSGDSGAAMAAGSGSADIAMGAGSAGSAAGSDTTTPGPEAKLVERGAYVAKASGCLVCHTAIGPTGPDFANVGGGGLEMPDPIGTWRTPNITPDKGTGIGNWTDEQIIAAVRTGVRPDGKTLYPIMPYMNYNAMTDDDAKALVAFLHTLKPVERTVAPNKDLKMKPIDAPPPSNGPDDASDPVKHGQYLATLMLCNHCHWTPKKDYSGPVDMNHLFSGGFVFELPMLGSGKLYAANLTSDPDTGLGKWTEEQIATTIQTMVRPDGRPIFGPMQFLQGGWSQLEDSDIKAVAAFIKTLPPVKNKVPASTFKPNGPPPGAPGAPSAPGAAGSASGAAGSSGSAAGSSGGAAGSSAGAAGSSAGAAGSSAGSGGSSSPMK
jgi:cytochrome c553